MLVRVLVAYALMVASASCSQGRGPGENDGNPAQRPPWAQNPNDFPPPPPPGTSSSPGPLTNPGSTLPGPGDALRMPTPNPSSLLVGSVLGQGDTNWCWAYSAFHAMRGYYLSLPNPSPVATRWRDVLVKIDGDENFAKFMEQRVDRWRLGDPNHFYDMLRREYGLPDDGWGYQGSLDDVPALLRKGIPSALCNEPHCVTVIGMDASATRFKVADSNDDGVLLDRSLRDLAADGYDIAMTRSLRNDL